MIRMKGFFEGEAMNRIRIKLFVALVVMTLMFATVSSEKNNLTGGADLRFASQRSGLQKNRKPEAGHQEARILAAKLASAARMLQRFWTDSLAAQGRSFRPPRIVLGGTSAYYVAESHTIYLNPEFLISAMRAAAAETGTDGDMAPISILAHEYAHAVQKQTGRFSGASMDIELEADCMAGAFVKAAKDAGLLEPGDLDEATYTFFISRDPVRGRRANAGAHGNGTQRVAAFHKGLAEGLGGCGCK